MRADFKLNREHRHSHRSPHVKPVICLRAIALACCLWCLAGCVPAVVEDPLAVMVDREVDYRKRRVAARQAVSQLADDPRLTQTLQRLLWDHGYPSWQRIDAIDMLMAIDQEAFRRALSVKIMTIGDRAALEHVFELAIRQRWMDFTPLAVQSYGRADSRVADFDRSERRVIEALNPGRSVEQVVFEQFVKPTTLLTRQVSAWALLCRVYGLERARQLLKAAPPTPLVSDLRAVRDDFALLPESVEGVLWVLHLLDPTQRAFYLEAKAVVGSLDERQRRGLEVRHLPVLVKAGGQQWVSRALRLSRLATSLDRRDHHHKSPADESAHTIRDSSGGLCWADLLVLEMLLEALDDQELLAQLFEQADGDLAETATEYGGVLDRDRVGRWQALLYKPLLRRGDRVFVPPAIMIERLYSGLYHYHFHAQQHDNGRFAGPGKGDLGLAGRLGFNFVIFTFIDADHINADYHQANGVVIDMGTFRRPSAGRNHVQD